MATLTVAPRSYAEVPVASFEGRVFVYVPGLQTVSGSRARPFQLWIVQGVYGRPFLQRTGPLEESGFDRMRRTQNIRAFPVDVRIGNGSDMGEITVSGHRYVIHVVNVDRAGGGVRLRICE
jgi:hypothetical protein